MRVVIIGGTGHIGSYLTPRLVEAGNDVTCISRGVRGPYLKHSAWEDVTQLNLDRSAEERAGTFGERVVQLDAEAIIDLTCYSLESATQLAEALQNRSRDRRTDSETYLLHCGTIWVHGPSVEVPTTEEQPRRPFGDYGIRKASIEAYLLDQARSAKLAVTVLHPGHLVGPGWNPINPNGNFNPKVFTALASGIEVAIPNIGMETVHHVHVDDVAQCFMMALAKRDVALGESFHVVSPAALTLRGYAETMASWFGQPARLRFLPYEEWRQTVSEKDAAVTWDHIAHSPNCSIQKARELLGYSPRYSSLEAVKESVGWMRQNGVI
jgi:nucleoside-diphosphate-sugar epimerase